MNSENNTGPNEPLEFKILDLKAGGFVGPSWFDGKTKVGNDDELEAILNAHGAEGWDVVQYIAPGMVTGRIILRRRAR